jgi:hypothetical protein
MGPQLWRRASKRRQRRDGDDLPRARVEHGVLVDFSIDRLEHIGCELRSHVAERSFDLIRGLPEDLTDFLCRARGAEGQTALWLPFAGRVKMNLRPV